MNYVEVKGGLGNQLFQYTFYKYLEKKSGHKVLLHTDFFKNIDSFEEATKRKLGLDRFDCDFVAVSGFISCEKLVKESDYKDSMLSQDEVFFSGYWQNKRFFLEVMDDIRKDLLLKDENIQDEVKELAKELRAVDSVAIHFRRGDYLSEQNKKIFTSLSVDYYQKAIAQLAERNGADLKGYIFTDEPEYVSGIIDQLGSIDIKLMPVREDYEDLYLMSCARHHIIANSSFSWWGAALGDTESGITIAPAKWYVDGRTPDLYLRNWISI